MPDQRAGDGDLPTLEGEIARLRDELERAQAAGTPLEVCEVMKRDLELLQRAASDGSVFLRARTGDGGTILGFNLPSDIDPPHG